MNESLLPTRNVLQGGEVLRIVTTDGRRMVMPLAALLDAAEARFATRAGEAGLLADCWRAINAQRDDIAVLTARILVQEAKPTPAAVNLTPLLDRIAALEARPIVSTVGLATQASVNTVASSASTNAADIAALAIRVAKLESEIKLKKDK
jgi:hypothetical protein